MTRQLELPLETEGEARRQQRSGEAPTAATGTERSGASGLMERVLSRPNLVAALKRVRKNKGSPGIDGMTVDELPDWLREHYEPARQIAANSRRWWRNSRYLLNAVLPIRFFDGLGLPRLAA